LLQYSLSHDLYQICNRGNGSRIPILKLASNRSQTISGYPNALFKVTPREASRLSKQSQTAHPPRDLSFRQAFAKPSRYLLANASLPSISSPHLQRCSRGQNSPNTPPRHICSSTAWCARRGCCQVHDRTAHRRSLLRMCTSHSIPFHILWSSSLLAPSCVHSWPAPKHSCRGMHYILTWPVYSGD
jgi:hypothetical protein